MPTAVILNVRHSAWRVVGMSGRGKAWRVCVGVGVGAGVSTGPVGAGCGAAVGVCAMSVSAPVSV